MCTYLSFDLFLIDDDVDEFKSEIVDLVEDLFTIGLLWLFWLD